MIRPDDDFGVYGLRQAEIVRKRDLCFEEHLVIYRGHPGLDRWTPYDSQSMQDGKCIYEEGTFIATFSEVIYFRKLSNREARS